MRFSKGTVKDMASIFKLAVASVVKLAVNLGLRVKGLRNDLSNCTTESHNVSSKLEMI